MIALLAIVTFWLLLNVLITWRLSFGRYRLGPRSRSRRAA